MAREVWQPKEIQSIGEFVGIGRRLTILPQAGVELYFGDASKFSLRSVDAASFAMPEKNVFDLHSGSFVVSSNGNGNSATIKSPLSTVQVSCDTPFALMIGITTNGGIKFIALVGECKLEQEKLASSVLSPGIWFLPCPKGSVGK